MKHLSLMMMGVFLMSAISFAQTAKKIEWKEMKAFHEIMSTVYHPTEEGNFAPLKEKAIDLFKAAKVWRDSKVPSELMAEQTKAMLNKLLTKGREISSAVQLYTTDNELKVIIVAAHDMFHKIAVECDKVK
jgi:hypothetical protein